MARIPPRNISRAGQPPMRTPTTMGPQRQVHPQQYGENGGALRGPVRNVDPHPQTVQQHQTQQYRGETRGQARNHQPQRSAQITQGGGIQRWQPKTNQQQSQMQNGGGGRAMARGPQQPPPPPPQQQRIQPRGGQQMQNGGGGRAMARGPQQPRPPPPQQQQGQPGGGQQARGWEIPTGRVDDELTRIVRKGAPQDPSKGKSRQYKPRDTHEKFDCTKDELNVIKKRVGDRLLENYKFTFRYAFTKFTEASQKSLIFTVMKEFSEEQWEYHQIRSLLMEMAEDRTKSYKAKKKMKGTFTPELDRKLKVLSGTVNIISGVPLQPGWTQNWEASDDETYDNPPPPRHPRIPPRQPLEQVDSNRTQARIPPRPPVERRRPPPISRQVTEREQPPDPTRQETDRNRQQDGAASRSGIQPPPRSITSNPRSISQRHPSGPPRDGYHPFASQPPPGQAPTTARTVATSRVGTTERESYGNGRGGVERNMPNGEPAYEEREEYQSGEEYDEMEVYENGQEYTPREVVRGGRITVEYRDGSPEPELEPEGPHNPQDIPRSNRHSTRNSSHQQTSPHRYSTYPSTPPVVPSHNYQGLPAGERGTFDGYREAEETGEQFDNGRNVYDDNGNNYGGDMGNYDEDYNREQVEDDRRRHTPEFKNADEELPNNRGDYNGGDFEEYETFENGNGEVDRNGEWDDLDEQDDHHQQDTDHLNGPDFHRPGTFHAQQFGHERGVDDEEYSHSHSRGEEDYGYSDGTGSHITIGPPCRRMLEKHAARAAGLEGQDEPGFTPPPPRNTKAKPRGSQATRQSTRVGTQISARDRSPPRQSQVVKASQKQSQPRTWRDMPSVPTSYSPPITVSQRGRPQRQTTAVRQGLKEAHQEQKKRDAFTAWKNAQEAEKEAKRAKIANDHRIAHSLNPNMFATSADIIDELLDR